MGRLSEDLQVRSTDAFAYRVLKMLYMPDEFLFAPSITASPAGLKMAGRNEKKMRFTCEDEDYAVILSLADEKALLRILKGREAKRKMQKVLARKRQIQTGCQP